MNEQTVQARAAAPDTHVLSFNFSVPGLGVIPINAFVIHAKQPVLVDTGFAGCRESFLQALEQAVAPESIRWIWLTHVDPDHVGNLAAVMDAAPEARVVTTYLGMGKLGLLGGFPPERMFLLNPGQRLDVGDRQLQALRPPVFDAPETTALFDPKTETLFSADSCGAVLQEPVEEEAGAITPEALKQGMLTWASIDAPWLELVDAEALAGPLKRVRDLSPKTVLSSHLPPASGIATRLFENIHAAAAGLPFVGPDQAELEKLMQAAGAPPQQPAAVPEHAPRR
jgi:hypothetical protein